MSEFDTLVKMANDHLSKKWNFKEFILSFSIFPLRSNHPIYDNDKLSYSQKNAIMIASDIMRIDNKIDKEEEKIKLDLYNFYKSIFEK